MLQKTLTELDSKGTVKGLHKFSSKNQGIVGLIIEGFAFIVGVGAIPFKLVTYKNLGQRSFGILAFIISITFYALLSIGLTLVTGFSVLSSIEVDPTVLRIASIMFSGLNFSTVYMAIVFLYGYKFLKTAHKDFFKLTYDEHSYYRGDLRYGSFEDYKDRKRLGFIGDSKECVRMYFTTSDDFKDAFYFILIGLGCVGLLMVIKYFEINNLLAILIIPVASIFYTSFVIMLSSFFAWVEEYGIQQRKNDAVLDMLDSEKDVKLLMDKKAMLLETTLSSNKLLNQPNIQFSKKKKSYPIVRVNRNR